MQTARNPENRLGLHLGLQFADWYEALAVACRIPFPRLPLALAVCGIAACQSYAKVETVAAVAGFERTGPNSLDRFLYCNITLGWTEEELLGACGVPVAIYLHARTSGQCWAYKTVARPIGVGLQSAGPLYYLACTLEGDAIKKNKTMRARFVTSVHAVSELPAEATQLR